jgi:MoxR-like ATPase
VSDLDATALAAKLQALRRALKGYFVERDEVIDGALAGLLAGEHVLLLGPVGTAKSLLARTLCERIRGAAYFGWLLTKFSTPEEVFGPVSLAALEADTFRRVTAGKLPEAHIAFLDEIFKANSAILNSLLAILNERVYHNGTSAEAVPLLALFGASNELPEEGELMALYDRFMLRFELDYVADDAAFLRMLSLEDELDPSVGLDLAQLTALQAAARRVEVPRALLRDLAALRARLNDEEIEASDRRYRKSLDVLRAYAFLAGRGRVETADLVHLQHVLWTEPSDRAKIAATVDEVARRYALAVQGLREKAHEQHTYATRYWAGEDERVSAVVESLAKLRGLMAEADRLGAEVGDRDDAAADEVAALREEIGAIVEALLHGVGAQRQ